MQVRTKTEKTIAEYTSRVITMAKRINCPHDSPQFPDELLNQLLVEKPSISKATWFKKKASLLYYFEQLNRLDLKEQLQGISPDGSLTKTDRTSGQKKKSLTEVEESSIREELETMAKDFSSWGKHLLAFTECILLTGMRPIELNSAAVYENVEEFRRAGYDPKAYSGSWPMLHVHNGKQTNGRSFGEKRHLDLSYLNKKQLLFIKIALIYAHDLKTPNGHSVDYTKFYNALRQAFARVINKLFNGRSRHISLYTYRHQCIADMKSDNSYSLQQIAAIVGHGNDLTATEHYGRKRSGRSRGEKVKANEVDVSKVRPLMASKLSKLTGPNFV
ncbi:site-specific integrase [Salinimonas chungwhensis]|nr:site-specific integrase [Salinimonas chungwhensis]